jgi:hypothetical protein
MKPTSHLRFVTREGKQILEQWWVFNSFLDEEIDFTNTDSGYWNEIEVINET